MVQSILYNRTRMIKPIINDRLKKLVSFAPRTGKKRSESVGKFTVWDLIFAAIGFSFVQFLFLPHDWRVKPGEKMIAPRFVLPSYLAFSVVFILTCVTFALLPYLALEPTRVLGGTTIGAALALIINLLYAILRHTEVKKDDQRS